MKKIICMVCPSPITKFFPPDDIPAGVPTYLWLRITGTVYIHIKLTLGMLNVFKIIVHSVPIFIFNIPIFNFPLKNLTYTPCLCNTLVREASCHTTF